MKSIKYQQDLLKEVLNRNVKCGYYRTDEGVFSSPNGYMGVLLPEKDFAIDYNNSHFREQHSFKLFASPCPLDSPAVYLTEITRGTGAMQTVDLNNGFRIRKKFLKYFDKSAKFQWYRNAVYVFESGQYRGVIMGIRPDEESLWE